MTLSSIARASLSPALSAQPGGGLFRRVFAALARRRDLRRQMAALARLDNRLMEDIGLPPREGGRGKSTWDTGIGTF